MNKQGKNLNPPFATNVVWFVVDSVRNYYTDADDRGRLEIMDYLAQSMVEFETAITSAPSTVMSTSAMMTGVPAIFHSRTYNDFDYDSAGIESLPRLLEKKGYNLYNIIFFPEGRQFLKPMMGNICEDKWPLRAKPAKFWGNDVVNEILQNVVRAGLVQPFFLFVNYNCRWDPRTSEEVRRGISLLESNNYLDDAVFVINSDHGYPDESRNISLYEKRKYGHDLILTDDNILVPLIIGYPDCVPRTITTPVSLLDIMPTILGLLGYSMDFSPLGLPSYGRSLLNIIENGDTNNPPIVSVDNRYIFQNERKTALRDNIHKYIFSFSDQSEEFYKIGSDKVERYNLIDQESYQGDIDKFRRILSKQEKVIYEYHKKILKNACYHVLGAEDQTIVVLGGPNNIFKRMIIEILSDLGIRKCFMQNVSTHVDDGLSSSSSPMQILSVRGSVVEKVDLVLCILSDANPRTHYHLRKRAESMSAGRIVYTNYNLKIQQRPAFWLIPALRKSMRFLYPKLKTDPRVFLVDVVLLLKQLFSDNKNR